MRNENRGEEERIIHNKSKVLVMIRRECEKKKDVCDAERWRWHKGGESTARHTARRASSGKDIAVALSTLVAGVREPMRSRQERARTSET